MPNVLSPRDLVSRPDNRDETVPHMYMYNYFNCPFFVEDCFSLTITTIVYSLL